MPGSNVGSAAQTRASSAPVRGAAASQPVEVEVGDARGVGQYVPRGHEVPQPAPEGGHQHADRPVQVEPPLVHQLEHGGRHDGLGDARQEEHAVGRHATVAWPAGHVDEAGALSVGDAEHGAGQRPVRDGRIGQADGLARIHAGTLPAADGTGSPDVGGRGAVEVPGRDG